MKIAETAAGRAFSSVADRFEQFFKTSPHPQLTTTEVLSKEFNSIWKQDRTFADEDDYRAAMRDIDQAALCLSGGGIRSAAFSLGVIQALAKKGLLTQFQYLSTVSGGGYIGAWLSRFIHDAEKDSDKVEKLLAGEDGKPPPELPQIQALRANSNFITPQVGIASTDTWTVIMLSVRNLLLMWLIFVPALLIVTAVPNIYHWALLWVSKRCLRPDSSAAFDHLGVLLLVAVCLLISTWGICNYLPSHRADADGQVDAKQIKWRFLYFGLAWAFLLPFVIAVQTILTTPNCTEPQVGMLTSVGGIDALRTNPTLQIAVAAFVASMLGYLLAYFTAQQNRHIFAKNAGRWSFISLITAFVLWAGITLIELVPIWVFNLRARLLVLTIFGPLFVTLVNLLQSTLYVGFRRTDFQDDTDREWLGRLSAMKVFPALLWALFAAICVLLPPLLFNRDTELSDWVTHSVTAVTGVVAGIVAVFGGKSSFSALDLIATPGEKKKAITFDTVIKVATLLFIALLLALLARIEGKLAVGFVHAVFYDVPTKNFTHFLIAHIFIFFVLSCVVFVSSRIDVNQFSLHGIYRNRLVRAFLGGARLDRTPNKFTGFDPKDNLRLHNLREALYQTSSIDPKLKWRPLFPVVNATLNLIGGDNLAWQERKASSFVMTPLACGSATLGDKLSWAGRRNRAAAWTGAFVGSDLYAGHDVDVGDDNGTGLSLGTAMTISGAAMSPNQGYHSSPATAFLLTLFNVRLGAWLPNPAGRDELRVNQAGNALTPLLDEVLGRTNDQGDNLYLSDGGHFENLGIYEMIRRRCRFIFVVDAGQDHECVFEDLGKAVRQSFIDLEATIEFETIAIRPRDKATGETPAFAVGKIHYSEGGQPGLLIYLKPTYFIETVPIEVRAYGEANSLFPHESTLDQWFSESQFESYRRLGFFLTSNLGLARSPGQKTTDTKTTKKTETAVTKTKVPDMPSAEAQAWKEIIDTKETVHTEQTELPMGRPIYTAPQYPSLADFFNAVANEKFKPRV